MEMIMRRAIAVVVLALITSVVAPAQGPRASDPRTYVRIDAKVIALTHVRVIDGTGAPARDDQTLIISGGKIQSIGPSGSAPVPADAKVLDLHGYSVLPGLVGMHENMFFPEGH